MGSEVGKVGKPGMQMGVVDKSVSTTTEIWVKKFFSA